MRRFCLLGLSLWLVACGSFLSHTNSASDAQAEPTDEEISETHGKDVSVSVSAIRAMRQAALAAPSSLPAAVDYAQALAAGLRSDYQKIQHIDWANYSKDAVNVLEASTKVSPSGPEKASALYLLGTYQSGFGNDGAAMTAFKAAYAIGHTYDTGLAMVWVHRKEQNIGAAQSMCEKTRPLAKDEDQAYELIGDCLEAVGGWKDNSLKATFPWISDEDVAMYERRMNATMQRNLAQRQADEAAYEERRAASEAEQSASRAQADPKGSASTSSSRDSEYASYTLRSRCNKTVKVFIGTRPKYSSGTTTHISGNSVQNERHRVGQTLWIVDDSDNGLASTTVSPNIREIIITANCSSFTMQ